MEHRDINSICRACLLSKEAFNYFLFKNVNPEMFSYCTSIKINKCDKITRALCDRCYKLLRIFCAFKLTCIKNQTILVNNEDLTKTELVVCDYDCSSTFEGKNKKVNDESFKKCTVIDETAEEQILIKCETIENNFEYTDLEPGDLTDFFQKDNTDDPKLFSRFESYDSHNEFADSYEINTIDENTLRKMSRSKNNIPCGKAASRKKSKYSSNCNTCKKKLKCEKEQKDNKATNKNGSNNQQLECLTCNKTFKTATGLKRHIVSEHTVVRLKALTCKVCGKVCKNERTLKYHQAIHGPGQTVCDYCGKGFSSRYIKAHLEVHKNSNDIEHSCQHCGKAFSKHVNLMCHISKQHRGKVYTCDVCDHSFKLKNNLSIHMLTHAGIRQHKCSLCFKSFSRRSILVEHVRTHSGEKPFACNTCAKCFISKRRLKEHLRMHTGELPYTCNVCGRGFTQRGSMTRHMKLHKRNSSLKGQEG